MGRVDFTLAKAARGLHGAVQDRRRVSARSDRAHPALPSQMQVCLVLQEPERSDQIAASLPGLRPSHHLLPIHDRSHCGRHARALLGPHE